MDIKAKFSRLTAQQGKVQLTFELDEACGWALPDLATLAGGQVMVSIVDPRRGPDLGALAGALVAQAEAADAQDDGEPHGGGDVAL